MTATDSSQWAGQGDLPDERDGAQAEQREVRTERPALALEHCHVAMHLLLPADPSRTGEDQDPGDAQQFDPAIDSYERDMLAYAYRDRDRRKFQTRLLGEPTPVRAVFPFPMAFVSEDTAYRLETASGVAEREICFEVTTCVTRFRHSGRQVLHMTLSPVDALVNEYDLIRLAKLWEGGERTGPPVVFCTEQGIPLGPEWPSGIDDPGDRSFDHCTGQTLVALAAHVLGAREQERLGLSRLGSRPVALGPAGAAVGGYLCVGTLDLLVGQAQLQGLLASVITLLRRPSTYNRAQELVAAVMESGGTLAQQPDRQVALEWIQLVAVGGLIQGLLDFQDIGVDELRDVYAAALGPEVDALVSGDVEELVAGGGSLTAVHKGTLLSVALDTERANGWQTTVNPYLAIPHAVALHNEDRVLQAAHTVTGVGRDWSTSGAVARKPPIKVARGRLEQASRELGQLVPNVFVYPSERRVYERCHSTRAIADLTDDVTADLGLATRLLEYREQKHGAIIAIIALLLGVLATVEGYYIETQPQLRDPLVVLIVALGVPLVLYLGHFLWRLHH